MNVVHPTIAASLSGFFPKESLSFPSIWPGYTSDPVADADRHFNAKVDEYFTTKIEYIGLELEVEVSVNGLMATQIFSVDGADLYYEFSEAARNRIARKAIMESGVEI